MCLQKSSLLIYNVGSLSIFDKKKKLSQKIWKNIIYFCKGEEFNNFTSQIRSPDLSPPLCAVEPLGTNDTYLGHRTLILMSLFNSSENRAPIPTIGCVLPPSHILQSKLLVIVGLQQSILNNEAMSNKDIK